MAEQQSLSKNMQRLADAIRAHKGQVRTALCGFDLWLEVMSSPHVGSREMVPGGTFATGQEAPEALKVPLIVLGNRIVISLDASLPPDTFELRA
jgi:hypothetical protein